MASTYTVGQLKKLLEPLPNDVKVLYRDPNFGGVYWQELSEDCFTYSPAEGAILVGFPFEEPVD